MRMCIKNNRSFLKRTKENGRDTKLGPEKTEKASSAKSYPPQPINPNVGLPISKVEQVVLFLFGGGLGL